MEEAFRQASQVASNSVALFSRAGLLCIILVAVKNCMML
jgi:hypothetical protein